MDLFTAIAPSTTASYSCYGPTGTTDHLKGRKRTCPQPSGQQTTLEDQNELVHNYQASTSPTDHLEGRKRTCPQPSGQQTTLEDQNELVHNHQASIRPADHLGGRERTCSQPSGQQTTLEDQNEPDVHTWRQRFESGDKTDLFTAIGPADHLGG